MQQFVTMPADESTRSYTTPGQVETTQFVNFLKHPPHPV